MKSHFISWNPTLNHFIPIPIYSILFMENYVVSGILYHCTLWWLTKKRRRKKSETETTGKPISNRSTNFQFEKFRRLALVEKFTLSISAVLWFSCFGTNNKICRINAGHVFLPPPPRFAALTPVYPSHIFTYTRFSVWFGLVSPKMVLSVVHFQNE